VNFEITELYIKISLRAKKFLISKENKGLPRRTLIYGVT